MNGSLWKLRNGKFRKTRIKIYYVGIEYLDTIWTDSASISNYNIIIRMDHYGVSGERSLVDEPRPSEAN